MRVKNILTDLRKEQAELEEQLAAIASAVATFERLENGGRRPRGRPRGSGRKADPPLAQTARQAS